MVGSAAGNRIFQNCCDRRQLEAAADIDQHLAGAGDAFQRLEDHRRQCGDETHHDDGPGAAPEDHQEQRIAEHDRGRGERCDPGFGRLLQQI